MGGGGYPASGLAAHRAPCCEGGDDPADRPCVHLAPGRHSQRTGCARTRPTDTGRHRRPPEQCGARPPRGPAARRAAPGHCRWTRNSDRRCPRRSGGVCRGVGCTGLSADCVRRGPLPFRTSGLHGRTHSRSEKRPRNPLPLRPDVLHRLGRAAHVGVQRDRPDARRHGAGPDRPQGLGDGEELPGGDRLARRCEGHACRSSQPDRKEAGRRRSPEGGGRNCGAQDLQLVRESRSGPRRRARGCG